MPLSSPHRTSSPRHTRTLCQGRGRLTHWWDARHVVCRCWLIVVRMSPARSRPVLRRPEAAAGRWRGCSVGPVAVSGQSRGGAWRLRQPPSWRSLPHLLCLGSLFRFPGTFGVSSPIQALLQSVSPPFPAARFVPWEALPSGGCRPSCAACTYPCGICLSLPSVDIEASMAAMAIPSSREETAGTPGYPSLALCSEHHVANGHESLRSLRKRLEVGERALLAESIRRKAFCIE